MKTSLRSAIVLGMLTVLAGCSSSDASAGGAANAGNDAVEVYSWWTQPGEREALQALFDLYKGAHPDSDVYNAAATEHRDAAELKMRLAAHDPPELFQENAHNLRALLEEAPGSLQPLDGLFDQLGLRSAVFPEVMSDVTIGGVIYAMPVNLHRENTLFYSTTLLAQNQIPVPTSFPELLAACEKLKLAGVTPIATSYQGWVQRIMFNSIAMGTMGAQKYYDFFHDGVSDPDALRAAVAAYADILDKYTNADASDPAVDWTKAADKLMNGEAAMFFHGDWTKGYFVQLGFSGDVDFGAVGAPGGSELFLYGADTFALPVGAKHEQGARDFLRVVASPEGQLAFNAIKGSSPMRGDLKTAGFDDLAQSVLKSLKDAKLRMMVNSQQATDDAFGTFVLDRDQDALYQVLSTTQPAP